MVRTKTQHQIINTPTNTMDYDDINDISDPSHTIKSRFYEKYIQPHLKQKPNGENLAFFLNEAWNAWRLNIRKEDIKNALFVEWICRELEKSDKDAFSKLMSALLNDSYDVGVRLETAERNAHNAKTSANTERIFRDNLELYKVFFESEFKRWAAVPYFYACRIYKIKNSGRAPEDFVNIGASVKFHALKSIAVPLKQGNIRDLVDGFDNAIRNAGAGHESWEIDDSDRLILHPTDPETGQQKSNKQITLTVTELEALIKRCRKTLWILKMGISFFLNNTPSFVSALDDKGDFKKKEILGYLEQFAENRSFKVTSFAIEDDRKKITLSLKYSPKVLGESGQLFFGNGERYDLVNVEKEVPYEDQVLGIIQYLTVSFFKDPPSVELKLLDENEKVVAELKYSNGEIAKLLTAADSNERPVPTSGKMPTGKCTIAYQVRVPFGQRELFEKFIQQRNKN